MLVPAAVAAASVALASPAAAATVAAPSITVVGDPAGTVHTLTPGVAARWYVGETTRDVTVQQLTATLAASGDVAAATDADLRTTTVGLSACSVPWQGASCPGTESLVLAPTPLGTVADRTASVSERGAVPAQNYLLISVLLPADAPQSTSGKSTVLRLDLSVLGVAATDAPAVASGPGAGTGTEAGPGTTLPGFLARTGTRIGSFGLLAAAAVGTGAVLAALARRRRAGDGDNRLRARRAHDGAPS